MRERWLVRPTGVLAALTLVAGLVTTVARLGADEPAPLEVVTSAAEHLEDAGTARIEFTVVGEQGESTLNFAADGAMDVGRQRFRMAFDGPLGVRFHTVVIGITTYSGFERAEGTRWVRVDMAFPEAEEGRGLLQDIAPADPTRILDALGEIGSVERVGEEEVRDATAVRYQVTVTDPPEDVPGVPPSFDVWIADGRIVRTEAVLDTGDVQARGRFDLFDFGAPVDIEPPPDDALVGHFVVEREEDLAAVMTQAQQALTEGIFPFGGPPPDQPQGG